jgi:hypothetical protein
MATVDRDGWCPGAVRLKESSSSMSSLLPRERSLHLPDFTRIQNHHVVPEKAKLQAKKCRHNSFTIFILAKYAGTEHKNWILRIDHIKAVVATLIRIHDIVTEHHAVSAVSHQRSST